MEFVEVHTVVAVVSAGGISAGAARLGITKSAVSKRIRRLESKLGVRLFQRSTRPISLTEAGSRYVGHARAAIEAIELAEHAATELQHIPSGRLEVLCLMGFGTRCVAPILPIFLKRYPRIGLDLVLDDRSIAHLSGDFDVAIRAGKMPDSDLICQKIGELASVVCASPAYLERSIMPVEPADLTRHPCLTYRYSGHPCRWTFTRGETAHTIDVESAISVNNSEALRQLTLGGLGVARLPLYVAAEDLATGHLVRLLPAYTMPAKGLFAVWPSRRYMPEKTRVFLDFLMQHGGGLSQNMSPQD